MLNCFYWYSLIWSIILILYNFRFSSFNQPLDPILLFFVIFTIVISFIIGFINRKKFIFKAQAIDYGLKPIIIIFILFIANFAYAKSIPLFAIIKGTHFYGEFESIPFLYVILTASAFYYGINYFNAYLNLKNNKKRNLVCFGIIVFLFLLVFSRSSIFFLLCGAFILYLMSCKNMLVTAVKSKKSNIFLILIFCFVVLYSFGALGNVRSGYTYNDNSMIERIGLYDNYPSFLPKQFMWTYSYLTTPLANLNNLVKNNKFYDYNYQGVLSELINRTISKRMFPNLKYGVDAVLDIGIEREYFNASTGYFLMYNYGGYLGMMIQFFILLFISYFQVTLTKKKYNSGKENCSYIILLLSNILMFFYNSLNTTTISWWLIVNFVALLKKTKIVWRN